MYNAQDMASKEGNSGISTARRSQSANRRAVRLAQELESSMTVSQQEALRLAGALYSTNAEQTRGRKFVVGDTVLATAHSLISFANGDEGSVDNRVDATELLYSRS